jgi:ATP-dependent Clp protease ATP-binding subunit ClpA
MSERYTERARLAVVLAQEEARTLEHGYIGTEHILLGLLREEEGLAARVLESLDVTVDRVCAHVVRIGGSGEKVPSGQIPFTPNAQMVPQLATREALSLGDSYVGTEHILLGLLRVSDGIATHIVRDCGADPADVRTEVLRMLRRRPGVDRPGQAQRGCVPHAAATDDGAMRLLAAVGPQIDRQLGRAADAGDLLVALASIPDGFAARILAALGIDAAALAHAAAEARREPAPSAGSLGELDAELTRLQEQKLAKIEAKEFEAAAKLRDRERQLVSQLDDRFDRALTELGARLGLPNA